MRNPDCWSWHALALDAVRLLRARIDLEEPTTSELVLLDRLDTLEQGSRPVIR